MLTTSGVDSSLSVPMILAGVPDAPASAPTRGVTTSEY